MIDFIYYIANSFFLPILIAVITFYITKHFDKKKEIPRILLVHIEHGINIHEKIYNKKTIKLKGYYKKQRDLDNELKEFLIYNGYTDTILTAKLLENIVKEYRKKFDCGFTSNKITKFYLVKSNLYNKKDERIFRISYKDCYMKGHEYFCCTKIINSNDIIQNLRIKLDKKSNYI